MPLNWVGASLLAVCMFSPVLTKAGAIDGAIGKADVKGAECSRAYVFHRSGLSMQSCWVDAPADNAVGTLRACEAQGADATLQFGKYVYKGKRTGDLIEFSARTEFPFGDGCTWQSGQRVTGAIGGTLSFTYSESPIRGRNCASACTASATIEPR